MFRGGSGGDTGAHVIRWRRVRKRPERLRCESRPTTLVARRCVRTLARDLPSVQAVKQRLKSPHPRCRWTPATRRSATTRRQRIPEPAQLIGRETEIDRLRAFVAPVRVDGGALLVTGEPGVGKTALLEAAADAAGVDTRVIRAGVEFEAETSSPA